MSQFLDNRRVPIDGRVMSIELRAELSFFGVVYEGKQQNEMRGD